MAAASRHIQPALPNKRHEISSQARVRIMFIDLKLLVAKSLKPSSTEPMQSESEEEDEDDDMTNTQSRHINGIHRDARSVSSPPLQDRGRVSTSSSIAQRHNQPQNRTHSPNASHTSARDSVMRYFFGQAGSSGNSGSPNTVPHVPSHHVHHVTHTHASAKAFAEITATTIQAFSEASEPLPKAPLDGNAVAFEMKSLEKHIEAVSVSKSWIFYIPLTWFIEPFGQWTTNVITPRGNGNFASSLIYCLVLQYRPADDSGPGPKSYHAFYGESHCRACPSSISLGIIQTRTVQRIIARG